MVLAFAGSLAALCAGSARGEAAVSTGFEQAVDAYLQPLLRTNNFSGVILVARADEIVLHRAYGQASIEHQVPNRPDTVFQIASVSKPFTAAAIMLLSEQGKLDLRAPLSAVLPGYPNGDRLTIHHLLTHTSGIPNINDFPEYDEIQRRPHSPAELVAHFRDRPLGFEPGARYEYSNSNYNLLALVVERASGTDFGSFLQSAIFDRLALRQTGHHREASQIIPGIATGYAPAGSLGLERAPYLDWSVKISVTRDIARAVGALHFGLAPEPLPDLRAEPLAPEAVAALTGAYQFGADYYVPNALITVSGNGGHLEARVGDYGPYPFVQISPTRFLIRSFWVPADFTMGADGRATELVIDGRSGSRVPDNR